MLEHFVTTTNSYAEKKKEEKRNLYQKLKQVLLTKEELLWYIGVLLLWAPIMYEGITQDLVHLHDLLSRNCFEAISAFFYVLTTEDSNRCINNGGDSFLSG